MDSKTRDYVGVNAFNGLSMFHSRCFCSAFFTTHTQAPHSLHSPSMLFQEVPETCIINLCSFSLPPFPVLQQLIEEKDTPEVTLSHPKAKEWIVSMAKANYQELAKLASEYPELVKLQVSLHFKLNDTIIRSKGILK